MASYKDWLRVRGHHLCLTDTISKLVEICPFLKFSMKIMSGV